MTEAQKLKLAAARYYATNKWPYFATGLCALVFREAPGLGTMATNRQWITKVDPAVLDKWIVEEVAAALAHELYHLLFEHFDRVQGRHPGKYNLSADLEINDGLDKEAQLPKGCALPSTFQLPDDQLAEWYYDQLPEPPQIEFGAGNCGDCADGSEAGAAQDPQGLKPIHGDLVRNEVARAIEAEAARNPGNVPAGLRRWASARLKPKVDWKAALRASLRSAVQYSMGSDDYSWHRPNRRQSAFGNVRHPSMRSPMPSAGALIDTSGSMTQQNLARAIAEVQGVLDALQIPMPVWTCDTETSGGKPVTDASQIAMIGGGGTDMCAGIAVVEAARPKPDILIVITDGYTPWPDAKPRFSAVIVVKVAGGTSPDWAKTIEIPDTEDEQHG